MKNLYDYERTQSATTDLPFGALKNESSPGKQDGTDIVAEHIQDLAYSLYQVLQLAGINPNGELEDGNNKTQFIESLTNIGVFRYSDKTSYNYGVFTWQVIGNTFTLYRSLKNSNSDDVNNNESWLKILEIGADNKINFNVDTNILGLSANPSLSNLSEAGEDRLNVSKMYETGAVSNDTKGFKELLKRAHSTFDKSKFEVVGTPTITDDGVASGSSVNSSSNIDLSSSPTKWTFVSPTYKITTAATSVLIPFFWGNASTGNINFSLRPNGVIGMNYNNTTGTGIAATSSTNVVQLNTDVQCKWDYDNGTITMSYKIGSGDWVVLKTTTVSACTSVGAIEFSRISTNGCTCDLKTGSVTVDSKEVFSGNKTGLYVAKPDNYEVVGSPTISDDGILTNCPSQNDYLSATIPSLSQFEKVRIEFELKVKEVPSSTRGIFNIPNDENPMTANFGTYAWLAQSGFCINLAYNSTSDTGIGSVAKYPIAVGDFIKVIAEGNKTSPGSIKVSKNNGVFNDLILVYSKVCNFQEATKLFLGITGTGRQMQTAAEFDINSFKIYGDDNLIYQPCLKIPYTEADSTSRIVDVAYRDRVQDLYEQTGEALFYTIDEQNQNFSLPAGDIYGMITKNREILDIVYPIGRPMPEENNVLLDNEVWLEGATVNIVDYPKLFKVYGTKYGGDGTTTFKLPDMRNRVLWGSSDGSNGYIESKLPNIKGNVHLEGDGGSRAKQTSTASGAFNWINPGTGASFENTGGGQPWFSDFNFDASRSNSIYSDSAKIVQPPAFKVRWKTRFE